MIFLIVFLCIFNVLMWIVFLLKFKKLFTTEDIIENSKIELNNVISDMNRSVARNINLIDDAISRLNAANSEADKKIRIIEQLEKQNLNLSEFNSRIAEVSQKNQFSRKVENAYNSNRMSADSSIRLTKQGETSIGVDFSHQTIYEDQDIKLNETEIKMMENGASYAEIPVVSANIYSQDNMESKKISKDALKEKIISLFERGNSIEVIASELSCSTTEVQFALSIEGLI